MPFTSLIWRAKVRFQAEYCIGNLNKTTSLFPPNIQVFVLPVHKSIALHCISSKFRWKYSQKKVAVSVVERQPLRKIGIFVKVISL